MPLNIPSKLELKNLRTLASFTDKKVLEIGAGDGRLTWQLATEAAQWINLEPSAIEMRAAAKALLEAHAPALRPATNVFLAQGDGRDLSFPTGYFDIAFFSWSLC